MHHIGYVPTKGIFLYGKYSEHAVDMTFFGLFSDLCNFVYRFWSSIQNITK